MGKFLNSIWGSWLKVFAVAILMKYMDLGTSIFALNTDGLKHLVDAGLLALIPVVINYLNPKDTRYGPK